MSSQAPFHMSLPAAAKQPPRIAENRRKFGLVRIRESTQHAVTIREPGKPGVVIHCHARRRDTVPDGAKVVYVCFNHACQGQAWPDERAFKLAHPAQSDMDRQQITHLWGLWSNDPIDPTMPKIADCKGCKDEKGATTCPAHRGPVIGLMAPAEPRVDDVT